MTASPTPVGVYPICSSPPWHFRLAKWLIRNRLRGGFQIIELAERRKWLNLDCRYTLGNHVSIDVPLYRRVNQLALPDLLSYERPLVKMLAARINQSSEPVIWLDCGADIGILTALIAAQCPGLREVVAFEPNVGAYAYLDRNIRLLPVRGRAICAAVADFKGQGRLAHAPHDSSDHSRFLAPAPDGEIEVLRIDDLAIAPGQSVALKVDVEGGEVAVLRGAAQTLAGAKSWVVAVEAHRDVFHRTKIDPLECVRFLEHMGNPEILVSEYPHIKLNLHKPFFQQVDDRILNLVCIHRG